MERNNMKGRRLSSTVALILCVAVFVGATLAWFTDTVTSGRNKIMSGSLDVELDYATEFDENNKPTEWSPVKEDSDLFQTVDGKSSLWEPGHTEFVYLRVRNAGTLALKYNMWANVYGDEAGREEEPEYKNSKGGTFRLSEYLVFKTIEPENGEGVTKITKRSDVWSTRDEENKIIGKVDNIGKTLTDTGIPTNYDENTLYPKGDNGAIDEQYPYEKEFTVAVYMPTWVGNEANYREAEANNGETGKTPPTIYLGLTLNATQVPYENDSFDENYDLNAPLPTPLAANKTGNIKNGGISFKFNVFHTTVNFAEGSLNDYNEQEATLYMTVTDLSTTVQDPLKDGFTPVESIEFTLVINGETITEFDKPAHVETPLKVENQGVFEVVPATDTVTPTERIKPTIDGETISFDVPHFSTYWVCQDKDGQAIDPTKPLMIELPGTPGNPDAKSTLTFPAGCFNESNLSMHIKFDYDAINENGKTAEGKDATITLDITVDGNFPQFKEHPVLSTYIRDGWENVSLYLNGTGNDLIKDGIYGANYDETTGNLTFNVLDLKKPYTITVTKPAPRVDFKLIKDWSEIKNNGVYVIAFKDSSTGKCYYLDTLKTKNSNGFTAQEVTAENDTIINPPASARLKIKKMPGGYSITLASDTSRHLTTTTTTASGKSLGLSETANVWSIAEGTAVGSFKFSDAKGKINAIIKQLAIQGSTSTAADLYLYKWVDESESEPVERYEQITTVAEVTNGKYMIIVEGNDKHNILSVAEYTNSSGYWGNATSIDFKTDETTGAKYLDIPKDDYQVWKLTNETQGRYSIATTKSKGTDYEGSYLSGAVAKLALWDKTNNGSSYTWEIEKFKNTVDGKPVDDEEAFTLHFYGAGSTSGKYLGWGNPGRIAGVSTGTKILLFKLLNEK